MNASRDDEARERLALVGEIAVAIAHELRNALQVISSSAYVARQEALKGDAAASVPHVSKIERNAHLAHGIVNDLMALARGEPLRAEVVPLADALVASRVDMAEGAAEWHDALEPGDLRVRAHPGLLVRLLHAIYDNAVQASAPRRPRVATRARADGGRVIVEVTDDGPGVPPSIASRVFAPMVSARPGGSGLGLALAQRIAIAHGGSIALVDGQCAGGECGATFRVELPA